MRFSPFAAVAALLLSTATAAPATAGTLQIDPITVEISSGRKIASVRIRNEERVPVTIRSYVLGWTQVDGEDRYEDSSALILSPPIFTIPAGGTQLMRVGLRSRGASGKAYRLIVEEVPEARPGNGIQVALRLNLPLFAMIAAGEQGDLRWSAKHQGTAWVLEATNAGKGWIRVDPAVAATVTGLRQQPNVTYGVVLPGSVRRWTIGTEPTVSDAAKFKAITRDGDDGTQLARQ